MKNKKINLKTLKNVLSEKELKDVIGGFNDAGDCAHACRDDRDCNQKGLCPTCKNDSNGKFCHPTCG